MSSEIIGSIWFSSLGWDKTIGIVLVSDKYRDKAYIGIGKGIDPRDDEIAIARAGGVFPLEQAYQLIPKMRQNTEERSRLIKEIVEEPNGNIHNELSNEILKFIKDTLAKMNDKALKTIHKDTVKINEDEV